MTTPELPSTPKTRSTPKTEPALLVRARADFEAASWTLDTLDVLLSDRARSALARDQRIPALVELEGRSDAASILTRLFVLGDEVNAEELEAALPTLGIEGAKELALVEEVGGDLGAAGCFIALVDLRPHVVIAPDAGTDAHADSYVDSDTDAHVDTDADGDLEGGTCELNWWIASDRTSMQSGRALPADHVLGVGGASTSLLEMTIREPIDSALDMGCGCGIQAMHLKTHANRVVATDLSPRACEYTRFNAALNRLDIEVREGSLFEPVTGEAFDLVVTNPPFVITPELLRGDGLFEYRDGGMCRDELVRRVVREGPECLKPGGVLQMIGNWEIPEGVDPDAEWSKRLESWFEGLPVDAWVVQRDVLDTAQYVEMWLQDADPNDEVGEWDSSEHSSSERDASRHSSSERGLLEKALSGHSSPERALSKRALREHAYRTWLADFDAAGVGGVGMGFIAVRNHVGDEAEGVIRFDLGLAGARPRGEDVRRTLDALRLPEDLSGLRLVRADDVTEERHYVPGSADPMILILHQGAGLGRSIQVGTATSAIVGASDGELEVGQIAAAVALLTERDSAEITQEVDEPLRELLRAGMLKIVEQ